MPRSSNMDPEEFVEIKDDLGYEYDKDIADALGYGREQVNAWKNGHKSIPLVVAYLLRLWHENPSLRPESTATD